MRVVLRSWSRTGFAFISPNITHSTQLIPVRTETSRQHIRCSTHLSTITGGFEFRGPNPPFFPHIFNLAFLFLLTSP